MLRNRRIWDIYLHVQYLLCSVFLLFNSTPRGMPLALTEANLGRLPGGANDEEKMSQLCSRAQELSMLLGRVQGLMDDCPSTRDGSASRPPSTRPQPQPVPGSRPPTSHNRPLSNRPASGRPTTGRPLTGSTLAGSPAAPGSNDKAAPSMALRLTTGFTEGKMSAIDRFLAGTGGMKPSVAAPEAVQALRLYDEGRRMAEVATNDENAAGQERDAANQCAAMSKPWRLSLRPAGSPEASFSATSRLRLPQALASLILP